MISSHSVSHSKAYWLGSGTGDKEALAQGMSLELWVVDMKDLNIRTCQTLGELMCIKCAKACEIPDQICFSGDESWVIEAIWEQEGQN